VIILDTDCFKRLRIQRLLVPIFLPSSRSCSPKLFVQHGVFFYFSGVRHISRRSRSSNRLLARIPCESKKTIASRPFHLQLLPIKQIAIDTTPEFRLQALRENLRWARRGSFTHSHADHIMASMIAALLRLAWRTIADLRQRTDHDRSRRVFFLLTAFHEGPWFKGYFAPEPHLIDGHICHWRSGNRAVLFAPRLDASSRFLFNQNGIKRSRISERLQGSSRRSQQANQGVENRRARCFAESAAPNPHVFDEALTAARRIGAADYLTHLNHEYDHEVVQAELPATSN